MLCVSRHQGEKIRILAPNGDEIWVCLVLIDRNKCRIGIEAKPEYLIQRQEIIGGQPPPASGQGREGGA
jgi:sRNA-binding carbon storage regulator CsrA